MAAATSPVILSGIAGTTILGLTWQARLQISMADPDTTHLAELAHIDARPEPVFAALHQVTARLPTRRGQSPEGDEPPSHPGP